MSVPSLGTIIQIGAFVGFAVTGNWVAAIAVAGSFIDSKLRRRGLDAKQAGLQINVTSNEAALPVVYGRAKVGIKIVDMQLDSSDTKSLAVVGALCVASEAGGGISAIEKVWFDEVLAIDGATFEGEPRNTNVQSTWKTGTTYGTDLWMQYGAHAGTDAQVVDAELDTQITGYGATDEGEGIAYIAFWLYHNEKVFTGGVPNVTALVKGQLCFDVRDSTTVWTDNPVLHVWDWLTSNKYGLRLPTSALNNQSFIDAANFADELVSIPGATTHKRFLAGGAFPTNGDPIDVLQQLLSACRAQLVPVGAEYKIVIRQATTAETFELNEDNIVGDWEFFRGGTREIPNQLSITYIDPDLNYQPNTVLWPEPGAANGFLTADNNYLNQHHIELPSTDDEYRAQQIGMTLLKELRADVGCAVTANREALKLEQGDVVKLTHPTPGWTSKEFWVLALGITPDHNVRLLLREYDATAYNLDALNTKDSPPSTNLPDASSVTAPTSPIAVSGSANALDTQEGGVVPRVKFSWTASTDPFLTFYAVQFKKNADSVWMEWTKPRAGTNETFITPLEDGASYDFRVRAHNTAGVVSTWATVTAHTVTTKDSAPVFPGEVTFDDGISIGTDTASGLPVAVSVTLFGPADTCATGDNRARLTIPQTVDAYNLTEVHAQCAMAGTTGTMTVQIHNMDATADVLSTVVSIDSAELGSDTAATAVVINTAEDDVQSLVVYRFDVDAVHTTPALGLELTLIFERP